MIGKLSGGGPLSNYCGVNFVPGVMVRGPLETSESTDVGGAWINRLCNYCGANFVRHWWNWPTQWNGFP